MLVVAQTILQTPPGRFWTHKSTLNGGGGERDMVAQYFFPEGNVGFGSSATTLALFAHVTLKG